MNKKILALALSILVVLPSTVFADGKDREHDKQEKEHKRVEVKKSDEIEHDKLKEIEKLFLKGYKEKDKDEEKDKDQEKSQEAQAKRDELIKQIEAFKTAMSAKHEQMKSLQTQIAEQKKLAEQKKSEFATIIAELKAGTKTLSADQLTALISATANLASDGDEVKSTADVSNEIKETQDNVKKNIFNNALSSMDKVIAKLQKRLDALKQLNGDLDTILKLAKLATTPAPSTTTQTTTDNTTTTTGSTTQNQTTTTTSGDAQQTSGTTNTTTADSTTSASK